MIIRPYFLPGDYKGLDNRHMGTALVIHKKNILVSIIVSKLDN